VAPFASIGKIDISDVHFHADKRMQTPLSTRRFHDLDER
jgi:hypothetical protein